MHNPKGENEKDCSNTWHWLILRVDDTPLITTAFVAVAVVVLAVGDVLLFLEFLIKN
jgi:hypothetical protein